MGPRNMTGWLILTTIQYALAMGGDPVAGSLEITGIGARFRPWKPCGTPALIDRLSNGAQGGVVEAFGVVGQGKTAAFEPYEFVLGEKKIRGTCAGIATIGPK